MKPTGQTRRQAALKVSKTGTPKRPPASSSLVGVAQAALHARGPGATSGGDALAGLPHPDRRISARGRSGREAMGRLPAHRLGKAGKIWGAMEIGVLDSHNIYIYIIF